MNRRVNSFGPNHFAMDIKGFVMDQMGHFSVYDIAGLLFAVVVAICLGYAAGRLSGHSDPWAAHAMWAGVAALAAALVGTQLSLALVLVALLLLVRPVNSMGHGRGVAVSLVFGLGCGGGAALITVVAALPLLLLLRRSKGADAFKED